MPTVKKPNPHTMRPPPVEAGPDASPQATAGKRKRNPQNTTWFWNSFSVGFIGAVLGSLLTLLCSNLLMNKAADAESRLHEKSLEFRNKLVALEGINRVGGTVTRDFLQTSQSGSTGFKEVRLNGTKKRSDLRVAISYASLLPGIQGLDLEGSSADNQLMEDIGINFGSLDSLNISNTGVTKLAGVKGIGLKKLNIDQAPIEYYELQALPEMTKLKQLIMGLPPVEKDGKTPYRFTQEVRDKLFEDLVELESLQKLTIYEFNLDTPTRTALRERGVEVLEKRH